MRKFVFILTALCVYWACSNNQLEVTEGEEVSSGSVVSPGGQKPVGSGGGSQSGSTSSSSSQWELSSPEWLGSGVVQQEITHYVVNAQEGNWRRVERLIPRCTASGVLDSILLQEDSIGVSIENKRALFWTATDCQGEVFQEDSVGFYSSLKEVQVLTGLDQPEECLELEDFNDLFGLFVEGIYFVDRQMEIKTDTVKVIESVETCYGEFYESLSQRSEMGFEVVALNCDSAYVNKGFDRLIFSVQKSDSSFTIKYASEEVACESAEKLYLEPEGLCPQKEVSSQFEFQNCLSREFPKFFNPDDS